MNFSSAELVPQLRDSNSPRAKNSFPRWISFRKTERFKRQRLAFVIFIMKIYINTDGGSRGNPGPAALGTIFSNEQGEVLKKYSQALGQATNNEAEYQALIFALKKAKAIFGKAKIKQLEIEVRLDSELIVKQLNHQYKIEEKNLQPLFLKVWNLILDFGPIEFKAVPREKNQEADRLVNEALDLKQETLL